MKKFALFFGAALLIISIASFAKISGFEQRFSQTPVPEPATMLLLGTGLLGIAAIGRKQLFKK